MLKHYISLRTFLTGLLDRDDRGATAVEYGLLIAVIALVIITGMTALAGGINGLFGRAAAAL